MSWEAQELEDYLQTALEEHLGEEEPIAVRAEAPDEEGPGSVVHVVVRAGAREVHANLSSALLRAYLADEEAAVDEFKNWVAQLARRLAHRGA